MKAKNSKSFGKGILAGVFTILALTFISFSCKKDTYGTVIPTSNLAEAVKILEGEKTSGNIVSGNDAGELVINYNDGSRYILIQTLPGEQASGIASMASAELITSKYGIIVKDLSSNKTWLFANNDAESIKKFEVVRSSLAGDYEMSKVFGVTVVNSPNS